MSAVAVEAAGLDSSLVPGAMERTLTRELADGSMVLFEEAPVGWLTKAGEPRKASWRAYHYLAAGSAKSVRLPSTTTILDLVLSKPGLPPWAEARGIEGVMEALRRGEVSSATADVDAIATVRKLGLGAEGAKRQAAERGINVHALLEEYMKTGSAPSLKGHPKAHHGYIVALTNWLLEKRPEPEAVEQLVVHPEDGYAGRLDLRARISGALVTVDVKTQERAAIYPGAHYQVALYERAAVRCGDEIADRKLVVVFAADGEHREMPADHDDHVVDCALAHWRALKPIEGACLSYNRIEREARR